MTTKFSCLPSFSKSIPKFVARELHIGYLYPLLTGRHFLHRGKGYWYLCNEQGKNEGSEMHQLTRRRVYDPRFDREIRALRPDWFQGQRK